MLLCGAGSGGGGPPPATTAWNPADKNAAYTLSGSNLIATNGPGGGFVSLRAVASHSTLLYYSEYTITASADLNGWVVGIGNSTASLSSFCGSDTNSVGYDAGHGTVILNGSAVSTIQTSAIGNVIGVAIDFTHSNLWIRTNGGNWNANATFNPATNTGGISFSGLAAGPYFPCGTTDSASDVITANFGATAYGASAPAGFGNW